jgi:hypothetical protein
MLAVLVLLLAGWDKECQFVVDNGVTGIWLHKMDLVPW